MYSKEREGTTTATATATATLDRVSVGMKANKEKTARAVVTGPIMDVNRSTNEPTSRRVRNASRRQRKWVKECSAEEAKPATAPTSEKCTFYAAGYCKRGDKCFFQHIENDAAFSARAELACGICFEMITTFGLMESCHHVFCLSCIQQWRRNGRERSTPQRRHKECPACRSHSAYVLPSTSFPINDDEKKKVRDNYLKKLKCIPCKYFEEYFACPFGEECHYMHVDEKRLEKDEVYKKRVDESALNLSALKLMPMRQFMFDPLDDYIFDPYEELTDDDFDELIDDFDGFPF